MSRDTWIGSVLDSRRALPRAKGLGEAPAAEGGCGVIGLAADTPIAGRHLLSALSQMRNRGNGKGGGIAAVGLDPAQLGVSPEVLEEDTLLAVAWVERDPAVREAVERDHIRADYIVDRVHEIPTLQDHTVIEGLDVRPPDVTLYFVRPRPDKLTQFEGAFSAPHGVTPNRREVEDEYVWQSSFRLNTEFYAGEGGARAFVLSHGRDLLVLKMVGFGDDVLRYYRLDDLTAHVWIGHHRYPTKGRVWHPGGAHPFVGLNEALVHNGDFANYASVTEYLEQRGMRPLFQTDTEVAALVFDLHHRLYGYSLEHVVESLAPTTERDFLLLPADKQAVYGALQTTHIHGSPDGPWFFIIAQSMPDACRLIGITDTSMLRPQVFALQEGEATIAFAASEKQGIDAALSSLAAEDGRFWPRADRYWNARGGSYTDGGAFVFSVTRDGDRRRLTVTDKFGSIVRLDDPRPPHTVLFGSNGNGAALGNGIGGVAGGLGNGSSAAGTGLADSIDTAEVSEPVDALAVAESIDPAAAAQAALSGWGYADVDAFLSRLVDGARLPGGTGRERALHAITRLIDGVYATGGMRPSSIRTLCDAALDGWSRTVRAAPDDAFRYLEPEMEAGEAPVSPEQTLVMAATDYDIEGEASLAREIVRRAGDGWRRFVVLGARGHRFIGNGLGVGDSEGRGARIDVYGTPGDYLASGIDGATIVVHGNGQDQLAQIMKAGTLVVHGDVGQTFGYGAKGGLMFILGNAAGRPMINAVGRPKVVINGTCLDYLAESFMTGDPLKDGGYVILNGMRWDEVAGEWRSLESPYPGGNLFSLASGGAIYVRDPHGRLGEDQLNGGEFGRLTDADWVVVEPVLRENEAHFGLSVDRLLMVDGISRQPAEVYRVIRPSKVKALQAEEAWVAGGPRKRV